MPKTAEPVIQVDHLVKRYLSSDKNSVDDISFSVDAGEFFAFLGPNGAGKTTTISILTTLLSKSGGSVRVAGFDTETHANQVRQNIGVIFQKPSLDQNLTAEENIRLHAALYNVHQYAPVYPLTSSSYKKEVKKLAEMIGIADSLHQPVKKLSGGMKRKLEIIRALIHEPKILFLDEPTVGLDPVSRKNLWEYLLEVRQKSGTTIFLTTHYLDEAEGADRIAVINHGTIVSTGDPQVIKRELIDQYLIVDARDRSALERELIGLKTKPQGRGPFRVSLANRSAQDIIKKLKTDLTLLDIHAPSLEEAYLEIIKNGNDAVTDTSLETPGEVA